LSSSRAMSSSSSSVPAEEDARGATWGYACLPPGRNSSSPSSRSMPSENDSGSGASYTRASSASRPPAVEIPLLELNRIESSYDEALATASSWYARASSTTSTSGSPSCAHNHSSAVSARRRAASSSARSASTSLSSTRCKGRNGSMKSLIQVNCSSMSND
jgi:hypothetical protein